MFLHAYYREVARSCLTHYVDHSSTTVTQPNPPRVSERRGIVEVKATGGDTKLGGEDFDAEVVTWLLSELKKKGHDDFDAKTKAKARAKLRPEEPRSQSESIRFL